jgi:isoquinoline 1-oxidoreductase beta subunit
MSATDLSSLGRREFLRFSMLGGGGLVLATQIDFFGDAQAAVSVAAPHTEGAALNAFVRIAPDGTVSIAAHTPECGQGVRTSLPMLVAEELEVDWEAIRVDVVPLDPAYGAQFAGGSTAMPRCYTPLRQMGATARLMLVGAAAARWGVPPSDCRASSGRVLHAASGRSLAYGEVASEAALRPVPAAKDVPLKPASEFKIIGRRISGVDNAAIVTGKPLFGIDQKLPGMVYAAYEKCPVFGGRILSANLAEVKALPGVRDAFVIEGTSNLLGLMPGVAIIADSTWSAFSARRKLRVKWDEGRHANDSWAGFLEQATAAGAAKPGQTLRQDGEVATALAATPVTRRVEAVYSYPFISHANLEPQNCTAWFHDGLMEVWAPSQRPSGGHDLIHETLGLPKDRIRVHITRMGGGFGRRLSSDFMVEAAAIAQRVNAPVKLTWTREDDLQHDHYRPGGMHFLKGAVDEKGALAAWHNHFVTFGNQGRPGSGGSLSPDEFPARFVPNYLAEMTVLNCGIPMGPWRAPGSCVFSFVFQSFMDELAHAGGRDPLQFRLDLLGDRGMVTTPGERPNGYDAARMRGVVTLAAEKAGWGTPLPKGRGRGIAFHFSHRGYFANVAEVTVSPDGVLKVDRVVIAGDVGSQIVNPSGADNQVEGSVLDGLSAAYQELDIERGRIVQSNFHEYSLLRITDAPRVEVHYRLTDNPPTGLGEPALPPVAPAIANAVFAATGKRIRSLPFSRTDLRWS